MDKILIRLNWLELKFRSIKNVLRLTQNHKIHSVEMTIKRF